MPSGLLGVTLATLAVLAAGAGRHPGEARAILAGTLAVAAADGWLAFRALRRLDATMLTPPTATAGRTFPARASLRGVARPATVDPLVAGEQPTPFDGAGPFALVCHGPQRGVFNHLLVEVRCRSPLGLWAVARRIAVLLPQPLWVGPEPRPCPAPEPSPGGPGPGPRAVPGASPDLVRSARPYVPGDSRRLVHWPATAHVGEMMVRETEATDEALPALVVEVHGPGPGAEDAFGRAITAAAEALARDGRVRLVTTEGEVDDADAPIPRAVLMPATDLRPAPPRRGATRTVDRTETTAEGVLRRLAAAATAPPATEGLPPGAWFVGDRGDHR
jgi:uncharacterized protein (DUF58 family)